MVQDRGGIPRGRGILRPHYGVVIADDHEIVRAGIRQTLAGAPATHGLHFDVLAEAVDGLEALKLVKIHRPALLFLDIAMPLASGSEILTDIRRWSPDTSVIVFTGVLAPGVLADVVASGAHGVFSKTAAPDIMLDNLKLILNGGHYVAPELVDAIDRGQQSARLTARERQTLNMIISGRTNREIGALLHISPKTVDKHRTSLMRKLNVHSVAELLARALQDGLIGPD